MGRASAFELNLRGYPKIDRGPSGMALLDELKKLDIDPFDRVKQDSLPHDKKKPTDYLRCTNNFVNNKLAIREHMKLRWK